MRAGVYTGSRIPPISKRFILGRGLRYQARAQVGDIIDFTRFSVLSRRHEAHGRSRHRLRALSQSAVNGFTT